jgi:hypothetical protein
VTWADATVSSDNGSWPAITATTSALYVAYVTSGGVEVYRSINAGSTWTRYAWITEAEGPTDAIANVSITDGTDTPAIAYYHRWWTEIPRKSTASWTSLGTGGDLTATKKSVGLDPNNDYEIPAIATDGSTIAIAYICRDYYGNEDTGIWVMRVNGCITTYDQILAGYSYESPDIAYQGGGVFAVVYVYASGGNRVYRKTWNGSSWSGSMYLYNATTQEPRPRAIAYGGGDAICRASNGADVVRATADVDPVLMQGVSPSSVSGSIAAACEGSSSYTYLAVASESGAIAVADHQRGNGIRQHGSGNHLREHEHHRLVRGGSRRLESLRNRPTRRRLHQRRVLGRGQVHRQPRGDVGVPPACLWR